MRTITVILVVAACYCPATALQSSTDIQKDFDALLAKVKQSDESVDFAQLRRLYSQTASYSPYGNDSKKEMSDALNNKDFKKSRSLADEALKKNYLNVDAHFVKMIACDELKDTGCYTHHKYVARGESSTQSSVRGTVSRPELRCS
jgi:hypothetical protein